MDRRLRSRAATAPRFILAGGAPAGAACTSRERSAGGRNVRSSPRRRRLRTGVAALRQPAVRSAVHHGSRAQPPGGRRKSSGEHLHGTAITRGRRARTARAPSWRAITTRTFRSRRCWCRSACAGPWRRSMHSRGAPTTSPTSPDTATANACAARRLAPAFARGRGRIDAADLMNDLIFVAVADAMRRTSCRCPSSPICSAPSGRTSPSSAIRRGTTCSTTAHGRPIRSAGWCCASPVTRTTSSTAHRTRSARRSSSPTSGRISRVTGRTAGSMCRSPTATPVARVRPISIVQLRPPRIAGRGDHCADAGSVEGRAARNGAADATAVRRGPAGLCDGVQGRLKHEPG